MNAGNVASFACGRPHPQLGDDVPCVRSRFHAGDHRSEYDGSLKTWSDGGYVPPAPLELDPPELDEALETWHVAGSSPIGVWLFLAVVVATWLVVMAALIKYVVS